MRCTGSNFELVERRAEDDHERIERNAVHEVDNAHEDQINPAAEIAGNAAQQRANHELNQHNGEPDQ